MKRVAMVSWLLVCLIVLTALPVGAQEREEEPLPPDIIIGPPTTVRGVELELVEVRVEVTIQGQVATTRLAQTFRNPSEWMLEGEYLFPLPPDASITDMDMTVDGEKLEGQLMDAEQARAIYEEIVRRQMDPALLEWVGRGLFRTHIFPIPPGETRLIELEYEQLLPQEGGLFHYLFPLRQGTRSGQSIPNASVAVELEGDAPLRAIYSSSHDVDVIREGERRAIVGWEGRDVRLDEDFSLFWSLSPEEIDVSLLSYQEQGEDGFFLLLAAPPVEPPRDRVIARDVVLVLDTSGSMKGEKMEQARSALDYVLARLNPDDRFNVIAFSTGTRPFAQRLQPASEAEAARRWVSELQPAGSTNINRALLEALQMGQGSNRPLLILFLTDGLPTTGVTDSDEILRAALTDATEETRLFTFGVGYDVDTILLDSLAAEFHGTSTYVHPEERIEEKVSAFYETISAPILADVRIDWGDARVEEIYPSPLPDLFAGQQLVVVGRYREGGAVTIAIEGTVNGEPQRTVYDDLRLSTGPADDNAWLPRLWATRKIGTLLQSIRRHGEQPEVVEEIMDLGIRYGIVTPFTTFLVEEDEDRLFDQTERRELQEELAPPTSGASGEEAVTEAEAAGDLATSERPAPAMEPAPGPQTEERAAAIRTIGAKTFLLRDGVWIDTLFDRSMEREQVAFGSPTYFDLAARSPEVAHYLSVGVPLILVLDGFAYEIQPDSSASVPERRSTRSATSEPSSESQRVTPSPTAAVEPTFTPTPAPLQVERAEPPQVEEREGDDQESGSGITALWPMPFLLAALLGGAAWWLVRRRG